MFKFMLGETKNGFSKLRLTADNSWSGLCW